MPLTAGAVTARIWRVTEPLPPSFNQTIDRNLQRHAFRPINPERAELQSAGWVNIRQMLDSRLRMEKVLFRGLILVGLRIDRLAINQKLFRATLAQEIAKALREARRERLSREERLVIEDKVRLDLIKRTQPATAVHEMAWHLERGLVFFTSTSPKIGLIFSDLFSESFQVSIEPQFPYFRAQHWADRSSSSQQLLELLPSPFSPTAPAEVVEIKVEEE